MTSTPADTPADTPSRNTTRRLRVNPIACAGHGVCAELLPEMITLDEWGYPLLLDEPVPARLARQARRAVADCPALALVLADSAPARFAEDTQRRRIRSPQNAGAS